MMKILAVLLVALVWVQGVVFPVEENGVLVLDKSNYEQTVASHKHILVEFYAPWWQHCKRFAPKYESACKRLKDLDEPVLCAKVNGDDNKELMEEKAVSSFPTLYYYKNGEKSKYDGAMNEFGLTSWVITGTSMSSMEVDLKALDRLREKEYVFYGYFGPTDSKEFKMYQMIAKHDEFRFFVHSNDQEAITKYNIKTPGLVAFRQFDEPIVQLDEFERVKALTFIREKGIAEWMHFSEVDKLNIFRAKETAVFLIADEEKHKDLIKTFCVAAKEDKSSMMYAYAGITSDEHNYLRKYINVLDKGAPVLAIVTFEVFYGMMRFDYDGDANKLTNEDIMHFVKRFKSGALDRHYYDNQADIWYHLTSPTSVYYDNYENIVLDTDNDVLVYYYSSNNADPNSNYHTAMNKLSEKIGRPENLILGRYDWHKAPPVHHPHAEQNRIVLYTQEDKAEGIVYTGKNSVEGIQEFLEKNSKIYQKLFLQKEDL